MTNIKKTFTGYDITITHGDTLLVTIDQTVDGRPYEPSEGDSVRFAMSEKHGTAPSIVKEIPTDTMILCITKEEMSALKVGSYVYDIEFTSASGYRETFIEGKIDITCEVI